MSQQYNKQNVYPRLHLDISFADLATSILSFFPSSARTRIQHVKAIQSLWPYDNRVLVTLSVRTAFDLLLQALDLPPGSEVLMSAVNIQDMVEIVKGHALTPVPIDLDLATLAPNLEQLEASVSPQSRILLVAHLFGSRFALEPYAQFCQQHELLLVEDCAQAFAGMRALQSETRSDRDADVSFFSFGPIKSCTALGGAVTLVRDRTLAEKMQALEQQYPTQSERNFLLRVVKYVGLKWLSRPWVYHKLLMLLELLGQDRDRAINSTARGFARGDLLTQIRYRPPTRMLALLQRRLERCQGYERRAMVARQFLDRLNPKIDYPGRQAQCHSFWLVPLLVADPDALMKTLHEQGFDATRGNTSLRVIASGSSEATTPKAEYLLQHILYLPGPEFLPEEARSRLARAIDGKMMNKEQ
jgi:perosamine synthetase